jgi:uncharacterized protein
VPSLETTPPTVLTVLAVRRYPVKSMAGETLARAGVDARGLAGDRWYAVVDDEGRLACGKDSRRFRRRDAVFAYAAHTDAAGTVRVARHEEQGPEEQGSEGWAVGSAELDAALTAACGDPVQVRPEQHTPHHDAGPVSLVGTATLDWCGRELGVDADPRRLRANLLVRTTTPFEEEAWVGRGLTVGGVRLRVTERIERCRTIDLEQDGVTGTTRWLTALGAERDLCVGVYAEVVEPGTLARGDAVVPE